MSVKYLREQAARAERLSKTMLDPATCNILRALADQYRQQAELAAAPRADETATVVDAAGHR